jgi:hypothetical protein
MRKKITYKAFFVIAIVAFSFVVKAQNYKEDMLKIRDCSKTKYHSFKMKFEFYPYDSLSLVTDSMSGKCFIEGNSYYYKFKAVGNEYEYVKNTEHYMVIDHANKVMAIKESFKARAELWDIKKIDSLLGISAMKVSYKNIGHNEGEYTVSFAKGTWSRLKLVFNKDKYTLDKIVLYSSEKGTMSGVKFNKPRVNISYTDYSEAQPDNNLFSDARYVANAGDKVMAVETYKGYKVLDYLKGK